MGFEHINADTIRTKYKDWDFTMQGRERQALRMCRLAKQKGNVVVDFICPTNRSQTIFKADYVVWMNTITSSRYSDTDSIFERPKYYNYIVTNWYDTNQSNIIKDLKETYGSTI
jgi:adenylylsulfate kinase